MKGSGKGSGRSRKGSGKGSGRPETVSVALGEASGVDEHRDRLEGVLGMAGCPRRLVPVRKVLVVRHSPRCFGPFHDGEGTVSTVRGE